MGTEIPAFQKQISDSFQVVTTPDTLVEVIALNEDRDPAFLSQYAQYIGPWPGGGNKDVIITFPILFDEGGASFEEYDAINLPTILLVDQTRKIALRFDGAASADPFWDHFAQIIAGIDALLKNPPEN